MAALVLVAVASASYAGGGSQLTCTSRTWRTPQPPLMAAEAIPFALGASAAVTPVFLAAYHGLRAEAASERLAHSILEHKQEYDACLRGEGCPADLMAAEAAYLEARQRYDEVRAFPLTEMMGSATREVLSPPTPSVPEVIPLVTTLIYAGVELMSVLSIVAVGVAMLHLMQYDAFAGVDGSSANFDVYQTMATLAGEESSSSLPLPF